MLFGKLVGGFEAARALHEKMRGVGEERTLNWCGEWLMFWVAVLGES